MFVCYAIYNNPSHFTRVLLNRSIQNIVEPETRAIVDMAAGRRGPAHHRQLNFAVRLEILKPNYWETYENSKI